MEKENASILCANCEENLPDFEFPVFREKMLRAENIDKLSQDNLIKLMDVVLFNIKELLNRIPGREYFSYPDENNPNDTIQKGNIFGDYENNKAPYDYSIAFGEGTETGAKHQVVVGKHNKVVNDAVFVVGNGASDTQRSNALEIKLDENGKAIIDLNRPEIIVSDNQPEKAIDGSIWIQFDEDEK